MKFVRNSMSCLERLWIKTNSYGQYILDIRRYELTTIDRVCLIPVDENLQVYTRYFLQPAERNPRLLVVSTFEDSEFSIPSAETELEVIIYGTRISPRPFMTSHIRTRVQFLERALALFPQYENGNRFDRSSAASPLSQAGSEKDKVDCDVRLCKNLFPSTTTSPDEIGR